MLLSNKRSLSYEGPRRKITLKDKKFAKRSTIIQFTQILALLTRFGILHLIECQARSKDRLTKTIIIIIMIIIIIIMIIIIINVFISPVKIHNKRYRE